jgi:hypothetical protein
MKFVAFRGAISGFIRLPRAGESSVVISAKNLRDRKVMRASQFQDDPSAGSTKLTCNWRDEFFPPLELMLIRDGDISLESIRAAVSSPFRVRFRVEPAGWQTLYTLLNNYKRTEEFLSGRIRGDERCN